MTSYISSTVSAIGRWSGFSDYQAAAVHFMNHQWKTGAVRTLVGVAKEVTLLTTLFAAPFFIRKALSLAFPRPVLQEQKNSNEDICQQILSKGFKGIIHCIPNQTIQAEPHPDESTTSGGSGRAHPPVPKIHVISEEIPVLKDIDVPGLGSSEYDLLVASQFLCKAQLKTSTRLNPSLIEVGKGCKRIYDIISWRDQPNMFLKTDWHIAQAT